MKERTELSIYDPESGAVWEIKTGPLMALPESIESTSIGLVGRLEVTSYTLGHHELGVGTYLKQVSAVLLPSSSITLLETYAMLEKVLASRPERR